MKDKKGNSLENRVPLEEDQVLVYVPKGAGEHVKVVEVDIDDMPSEITVQVSQRRSPAAVPMLGVIVK